MAKVAHVILLGFAVALLMATPAMAQEAEAGADAGVSADTALISFSGAFGVGLTVIGAGYGIGKLASAALESMARQPEVAGSIQTAMIIAAASDRRLHGFFALIICLDRLKPLE